jgi:uncharacterized membrane protein
VNDGIALARARRATLAVWTMLIAVLSAWHLAAPSRLAAAMLLLVTVVPLLVPLPALWRTQRSTYRWAPLTLAPGLAWALTELVANPGARGFAVLAALLAFLALSGVVATLRAMPRSR